MKHLQLFENKGDMFWIVVYESRSGNYVSLFDDRESAENYYIDIVNDLKASDTYYRQKGRKLSNNEMIVTEEEADDWLSDNYDYSIKIESIVNKGKFELPEKLQIARNSKKYNL